MQVAKEDQRIESECRVHCLLAPFPERREALCSDIAGQHLVAQIIPSVISVAKPPHHSLKSSAVK